MLEDLFDDCLTNSKYSVNLVLHRYENICEDHVLILKEVSWQLT